MLRSVRLVSNRWMPELWASPKPFGLGKQHSKNFWEVFRHSGKTETSFPMRTEAVPAGAFRVVTRCGKQFNSRVHEDIDANTAASRDAIMMNPDDARGLHLSSRC